MGLDWPNALKLIRLSVEAARDVPGAQVFSGVGTDQLLPTSSTTIDDVIDAYEEQIEAVEACGGRIVLMASRALVVAAKSPDDYAKVYGRILEQVREPVIIHWLGEMFDPALAGYWGKADHTAAMDICIDIIGDHAQQGGRRQAVAARQGQGNPHAPPSAAGRAHVYRRRFQFRRTDRRRRARLFARAARHLRRHRAGGLRRACRARTRRHGRILEDLRADGAAVAASVQGADALLQDRHCVPCLSQRPSVAFRRWSAARKAGARCCIWSRRSGSPTPPASSATPIMAVARLNDVLRVHGVASLGAAMAPRVVNADEAAKLVASGDTLLIGGSGAGHSVPDALIAAIAQALSRRGRAARSHLRASGRARRPRQARHRASGARGPAQARGLRHAGRFAAGRAHGGRQQDRGLHAAAGRAVAADARNGGRPPRAHHPCRAAHLRRSAPRRRQAERTRNAKISSS